MEIKALIISMLLISGVLIGTGIFYTNLANLYDRTAYNIAGLNKTTQTFAKIEEMYSTMSVSSEQTPSSGLSFIYFVSMNIINAVSNTVLLILTLPSIFQNLLMGLISVIGLPEWFGTIIYGIVLITIILAIAEIFLKARI